MGYQHSLLQCRQFFLITPIFVWREKEVFEVQTALLVGVGVMFLTLSGLVATVAGTFTRDPPPPYDRTVEECDE